MSPDLPFLLALSLGCDVGGQTSFKIGVMDEPPAQFGRLPGIAWIALGLCIYAVEIFVWLRVLSLAPLTVAAPIASLNYIGVIVISRWLFGEPITTRQWAGALCITVGSIAVALSGG